MLPKILEIECAATIAAAEARLEGVAS